MSDKKIMYCPESGKYERCKRCNHSTQHAFEKTDGFVFGCTSTCFWSKCNCLESKTINVGKETALRYNDGKLEWSLVDFESIEDMVKVLMYGKKKYSAENWRKGRHIKDTCNSMMRHLISFMSGETVDKESGESHIGHIMANGMFLSYFLKHYPELDDRNKTKK